MEDSFLYEFINQKNSEDVKSEDVKKEEIKPRGSRIIDSSNLSDGDKIVIEQLETYMSLLGAMRMGAITDNREKLSPLLFDEDQMIQLIEAVRDKYGADSQLYLSISQQITARFFMMMQLMGEQIYDATRKNY